MNGWRLREKGKIEQIKEEKEKVRDSPYLVDFYHCLPGDGSPDISIPPRDRGKEETPQFFWYF